jgi:hypothetical protein
VNKYALEYWYNNRLLNLISDIFAIFKITTENKIFNNMWCKNNVICEYICRVCGKYRAVRAGGGEKDKGFSYSKV